MELSCLAEDAEAPALVTSEKDGSTGEHPSVKD